MRKTRQNASRRRRRTAVSTGDALSSAAGSADGAVTCASIDHLVLPFQTLAAARERFERLGFLVAPDAVHPFGTGNACVFFADGRYLEPLAVADRAGLQARSADEGHLFVARDAAARAEAWTAAGDFRGSPSAPADALADRERFWRRKPATSGWSISAGRCACRTAAAPNSPSASPSPRPCRRRAELLLLRGAASGRSRTARHYRAIRTARRALPASRSRARGPQALQRLSCRRRRQARLRLATTDR